jgi:hypothetical protein
LGGTPQPFQPVQAAAVVPAHHAPPQVARFKIASGTTFRSFRPRRTSAHVFKIRSAG